MTTSNQLTAPILAVLLGGCALGACNDTNGHTAGSGGTSAGGSGGVGSGRSDEHDYEGWGACFVAGTLVATPRGQVPIEQLREGDLVWAFDVHTKRLVSRLVTAVMLHEGQRVGDLRLRDGRVLRVTSNHPFFVPESETYVAVGELEPNTALVELQGDQAIPGARIDSFRLDERAPLVTVYNITVAEHENYFADGILVHNKSGGSTSSCTYLPQYTGTCDAECLAAPDAGVPHGQGGEGGAAALEPSITLQAHLCPPHTGEAVHLAFDALLDSHTIQVFSGTQCTGEPIGEVLRHPATSTSEAQWETYCITLSAYTAQNFIALQGKRGDELVHLRRVQSCSCTANTMFRDCYGIVESSCQAP